MIVLPFTIIVVCIYTLSLTQILADKVIAIAMIVVSVIIVFPVAGPVALITYLVLKKLGHDTKKGLPLVTPLTLEKSEGYVH